MFSPPYRSPQNPQELTRVTMRICAGGTGSIRVEPGQYGFNSVWTRFEIRLCVTVANITTHSTDYHPEQIRIVTMNVKRYTTRVDAVLRCGLKQIDAVRTGSIRILIRNWNSCKNFWTWPKKFFRRIVVTKSSGIDASYDAGETGSILFFIPYGPAGMFMKLS
jgi:hypothetical protein